MKISTQLFLVFGVVLSCALFPQVAQANRAEVMMLPTRVVMASNDRYTTVVVKNVGNATGDFSAGLMDMKMEENGMVVPLAKGETDPHSIIPYVHIAPRSFTLHPGESQNVRIMLRPSEKMADGEYRSHLRLRLDNDNVEATREAAQHPDMKQHRAQIAVKANLVLVIPVIYRHGKTAMTMTMDHVGIDWNAGKNPVLGLDLHRQGNRSSMGDFTVTYFAPGDSQGKKIRFFPGIPVYADIDTRHVTMTLDHLPAGVDLHNGSLKVVYAAQKDNGGAVLAEAKTTLSAGQ